MQVVQHSFDRANVGPADSRVVTSLFPATTRGQAHSCVVSSDLVLVCGSSFSLHTLNLGPGVVSWRTREAGGLVGGLKEVGSTTVKADTAGAW